MVAGDSRRVDSRHYYDLARLDRPHIGASAVQNTALLEAVVRFKSVLRIESCSL
jgi:hypothetical protein